MNPKILEIYKEEFLAKVGVHEKGWSILAHRYEVVALFRDGTIRTAPVILDSPEDADEYIKGLDTKDCEKWFERD